MPKYLRVVSKATGHESSIPEHRFNEAKYRLAREQGDGERRAPRFRTNPGGESRPRPEPSIEPAAEPSGPPLWTWVVPDSNTTTTNPVPDVDVAPETGHEADHEGES